MSRYTNAALLTLLALAMVAAAPGCWGKKRSSSGKEYVIIDPSGGIVFSLTGEFETGSLTNLDSNALNQLQVNPPGQTETFPFIWIALSARGTIAKVNTETGAILGEYATNPDTGGGSNVSRTTVSLDGSVWAGNRNDQSVIHVGLPEANQAVDRNGSGVIETSTGYDDALAWPNAGGVDDNGGVTTALDEAILHYVKVMAGGTRHITVDANNDIWVSGTGANRGVFELIDGTTGAIKRTEGPFFNNLGGYGGLIDGNGVIWSAQSGSTMLWWDPNLPIDASNPKELTVVNYGLGIDGFGNVWITGLSGDIVSKAAPDGTILGSFTHGSPSAQGVAVDGNNHVWVTSSLFSGTTCGHLLNDGTFIGNVSGVGNGSTGVAVDSAGKIWTANINSSDATRIDPALGPIGSDGVTPVGAVDLTVPFPATASGVLASPYNYSDMTGAVALGATSQQGSWRVTVDGGIAGALWNAINWNSEAQGSEPPGTSITVQVRASDTVVGLGSETFVAATSGVDLTAEGRFLEILVTLKADSSGVSPVLSDLRLGAPNAPPP